MNKQCLYILPFYLSSKKKQCLTECLISRLEQKFETKKKKNKEVTPQQVVNYGNQNSRNYSRNVYAGRSVLTNQQLMQTRFKMNVCKL